MTVCFSYDPITTSWVTPFDTRDTRNNPVPDGRISTYDIKASPHALSHWLATPVWSESEDEKLCDAFSVEMAKVRFYNEVVRPMAQQAMSVWQPREEWQGLIAQGARSALNKINRRQLEGNQRDDVEECDWMGDCYGNIFASGKKFIECAARELSINAYDETPLLAGAGIVLNREEGRLPKIAHTLPQTYYRLLNWGTSSSSLYRDSYMLLNPGNSDWPPTYIASIDGKPTEQMTDDEMASALVGPEGTYVRFEIAEYKGRESEDMCLMEPVVTGNLALRRTLAGGELMTKCGGIDLRLADN